VGDNNTGSLYLFRLNQSRDGFVLENELADLVAEPGEEAPLVFGRGFRITTEIQIGPEGALYLSSLARNEIYRITLIPEPGTAAILGLGLLGLALLRRRSTRS